MNEIDVERELREVLAMLKDVERKMTVTSGEPFNKDVFAIHLAVLMANDDLSEALEFIRSMYVKDDGE